MELWRDERGVTITFEGEENENLGMLRKLKPSRFHEYIYFKRGRKYVTVYFLIEYGEVPIYKKIVEKLPTKSLDRMLLYIYKIINNQRKLKKYVDNKFLEYERKIFDIHFSKKYKEED